MCGKLPPAVAVEVVEREGELEARLLLAQRARAADSRGARAHGYARLQVRQRAQQLLQRHPTGGCPSIMIFTVGTAPAPTATTATVTAPTSAATTAAARVRTRAGTAPLAPAQEGVEALGEDALRHAQHREYRVVRHVPSRTSEGRRQDVDGV